jgi:hypothetical protein
MELITYIKDFTDKNTISKNVLINYLQSKINLQPLIQNLNTQRSK